MSQQLQNAPGVTIELVHENDDMHLQRSILAPGAAIPEHTHVVTSSYVVVSGKGNLTGENGRDLGPGDSVLVAANAKHGWKNSGSDAFHIVGSFVGAH